MKTRVIATAAVLFAGLASPSFAFEGLRGIRAQNFVTAVSCDVLKGDEDKQAMCAQKCDDAFIAGKMHYNADINKVKADKKACDEKCGCQQNTKD
jgi:hypothetical protein